MVETADLQREVIHRGGSCHVASQQPLAFLVFLGRNFLAFLVLRGRKTFHKKLLQAVEHVLDNVARMRILI